MGGGKHRKREINPSLMVPPCGRHLFTTARRCCAVATDNEASMLEGERGERGHRLTPERKCETTTTTTENNNRYTTSSPFFLSYRFFSRGRSSSSFSSSPEAATFFRSGSYDFARVFLSFFRVRKKARRDRQAIVRRKVNLISFALHSREKRQTDRQTDSNKFKFLLSYTFEIRAATKKNPTAR